MNVLGIESTCDETGCAIVRAGEEILSNVIASQEALHAPYGGVIPELACRYHLDQLYPLLDRALAEAHLSLSQIDLIAVARGPGLIGAVLIGLQFAKGLAARLHKPFVGVNHVEAHLYAARMEHKNPLLPALGVVLSGGHTALLYIEEWGKYRLLGQTHDDALGEAFDKAAKLLGLPYPGGPHIEKQARTGDAYRFPFKTGQIKHAPYGFSFSGLKTALLYAVRGQDGRSPKSLTEQDKADLAASFQKTAFEDVVKKVASAAKEWGCLSIWLGGGVCQNQTLRQKLAEEVSLPLYWPSPSLCMDNAAMIAGLGYHQYLRAGEDSLELEALPRIPLG